MCLVIASQMDEAMNDEIRLLPSAPSVAAISVGQWATVMDADMFVVAPVSSWHPAPPRPVGWPGRLRWICFASAGVDFYPRWLLEVPLLTCARGVASEEIADYVMAAIYLQAKDLDRFRARSPDHWTPAALGQVSGSTVGIAGLGAIGGAVAKKALALGCGVVAARRRGLPSPVAGVDMAEDLAAVVASADHLVLALPSTDATRGMFDARLLSHAKPTTHLINVGRGSVLDHDALLSSLEEGRLGYATLDVTEPEPLPAGHPLWTHPRVRLTPHISANPTLARAALLRKIAGDIDLYLRGEQPREIVDPLAGY